MAWNTWITCEESVQSQNIVERGDIVRVLWAKDHGFCFEIPAGAEMGLTDPVALNEMGRFNHEAVAVDPRSGVVYETEDRGDGLIYRYVPNSPGRLAEGGRLQALMVRDQPGLDTRNHSAGNITVRPGDRLPVTWIDIEDVESPNDDLRMQGFSNGAARFSRGEGMWYGQNTVFFACTDGGPVRAGQIWKYTPSPAEGTAEEESNPGILELFIEPNDTSILENADNVTVAPWGDLIICEDGSGGDFLVGVTPQGEVYTFGRNAVSNSEFAGSTFSPDGSTLFVNIMGPHITLAITGPFQTSHVSHWRQYG